MKITVIYDSVYGNTQKVAEAIHKSADAQHDAKLFQVKDVSSEALDRVDLLIIGSPTHGGWFTQDVRDFLNSLELDETENMKAAAFDTSSTKNGEGAFVRFVINVFKQAAPRLLKVLDKKGFDTIESRSFWVKGKEGPLMNGELDEAKKWTERILSTAGKQN